MVMAQDLVPERLGMVSGLSIGFAVGMGGVGVPLLGAVADRWGLRTAMDATALLPLAALAIAIALPTHRQASTAPEPPGRKEPQAAGETWH